MTFTTRAMAAFVLTLTFGTANSAITGSAETILCSSSFGGVSGSCKVTKTVELYPGAGIGIAIHDYDRLNWNCEVRRELTSPSNTVLVGFKRPRVTVPSRNVGAPWTSVITVQTQENRPQKTYCTRNRSLFWDSAVDSDIDLPAPWLPPGLLQNAVDVTMCDAAPPTGGGENW
jgi:hypothetical protein